MAVRFIIGRAGTGKTHQCLEAIRTGLGRDPIDGPRLILLVPEQASLQMERAIIEGADGIGGAHRAEVLSFRRLAQRVLEGSGAPIRRALTEPARAMVLRHLLTQHAAKLRYYRRVADRAGSIGRLGGFVERLSATIAEFFQEAVEPDDLAELCGRCRGADPAQEAKLHDLHLIYAAYVEYLGGERLDPSQFLKVARERLHLCRWLHAAELWVDGFASLAGQETLTLIELARLCQHVDITAMIDPTFPEPRALTRANSTGQRSSAHLFARTYQTYRDLERAFLEAGLEVEDPVLLAPTTPPRFATSVSLAGLERTLFAHHGARIPSRTSESDVGPVGVELIELPSRRIEVDYAVARVFGWVQDQARRYRYRDVAIIVRDLEPYHDLLTEALEARGIPFFIDRRRPIAHHPLVELLRAAAAMAADDLSLESVRLALKTGLLPIGTEPADELENYLIAHGLSGSGTWRGADWSFAVGSGFVEPEDGVTAGTTPPQQRSSLHHRINETRRAFLRCTDRWLAFASAGQAPTGKAWAGAIVEWLEELYVGETLRRWAEGAEQDGDLDQAEEHRQVWREFVSFLDDLGFAFAEVTLTTEELADVLGAGLSGITLGLAPPMIDQVLVGSIDRSRHPDIKAAIIVGFNDGVFPKKPSEDSILNDDDREMFRSAGVRVGPPTREGVLDEALLLYTALTRASEALVVTCATADNDGKALRVSPYVHALTAGCLGLTPKAIGDPARLRETWDVLCFRDLTERLTMEFRSRPTLAQDDRRLRARWNELYDTVRADLSADPATRRALGSLDETHRARISPASVERLIDGPLRASVSRLETYAACPFQHFAKYQLRLRERAQAVLDPVDVGHVHHAVLEDFIKTLSPTGRGFAQLSEGELMERLGESCARIATRLPPGGALSDARNVYMLRRSASHLARVLQAQRSVSKAGTYRPRAAEVSFGLDDPTSKGHGSPALPALELSTPAGRHVFVRGFIDRVDLAELGDELLGIVVDYKLTRDKRLNMDEVYHGLSLQLLGYLLVLGEQGVSLAGRPVRPGGALYVSLVPKYESVDHPDLAGERAQALPGSYRPRGVILTDTFEALDGAGRTGAWSSYYSMYRKSDGSFGQIDRSDAADAGTLRNLLEHTRTRLGELCDAILDGNVAVTPYRLGTFSPCSWCPMSSVCRFEMGISQVRFLETLTRSEVFKRLA